MLPVAGYGRAMQKTDLKVSSGQMQVLLVAAGEADTAYVRELLAHAGDGQVHLDHVCTADEALARLRQTACDLLLCDYKPGDGTILRFVYQLRQSGSHVPVIFLSDHVNPARVAEAIQAGASDWVQVSALNALSFSRIIRYTVDMYCKERQRQKAEDMVRKLGRAVEQSADLVVVTDRAGVIEYVNPSFEALTGYSREEAVGRTPRILKSGNHPAEYYRQLWQTVIAGQVFRGVMMNRKKNGDTFFVEKTVTPLRDPDGKITHFISNDHDMTERRRLESQLQQTQRMDAIGRLAGGVAHDFNNLLMVISAYAELMFDKLTAEHPLHKNVQEILAASRRATELTRQLLAFGRKQMQTLQLLDLNDVIREIEKMLPRLIGEDVQLQFIPGEDLGLVRCDTVQVEQVLMNLAVNARDAMLEGGTLTIETSTVRLDDTHVEHESIVPAGDYVMLAVTDSGKGILPQHLPHIFEPFYSTKEEGKGTGLGLATVYGIVKQNGGFIWVYSEAELGTTFKIYLPLAQRVSRKPMAPVPMTEHIPDGSETVLLVEDEPAVRQSAKEFLTLSGYKVLEAGNGEDALALAHCYPGPIDLMITDVVMPLLGGAKLASQLLAERPQLKVLFVSGYAESTVQRHGTIDVTSNFLQKPFSLKVLARKIRDVLPQNPAAAAATAGSFR